MPSNKLDPRLRVLLDRRAIMPITESAARVRVPMAAEAAEPEMIEVLIRCVTGASREQIAAYGGEVRGIIQGAEEIVNVAIPAERLRALTEEPWVAEIEAPRQMFHELDLSLDETRAGDVHALTPAIRGSNVLLGVIDSGIDFRHSDFRNADGTSRIRFLWDQNAAVAAAPEVAVPFGRVYTKADLDAVLAGTPGAPAVPHRDANGHGTHVAGIAGGNGSFNASVVGLAPDAEYVIVASLINDPVTLGDSSASTLAYEFIVARALELERPVAINQSQGMNSGGHSGESLLEVAMDNIARAEGVVIVKSAGNEQDWRTHAGGVLTNGQSRVLELESGASNFADDILELWYDGADTIAIAVQPPGAAAPAAANFFLPGEDRIDTTASGNTIDVRWTLDASDTGDTRAAIFLGTGNAQRIQPGTWRLHLRADAITEGRYDVWIERADRSPGSTEQARFTTGSNDPASTISIPGTARRIITAGSYMTRGANVGQISTFSSRGPTRYGLQKPEIAAPGEVITSALSRHAVHRLAVSTRYTRDRGTSMAAPHVTGAAALVLEVNRNLTCMQVRQILTRSASRTGFAATAPDNTWGNGKLDVSEAIRLARTALFPVISNVTVNGTVISWDTDIATTGAVRFNTHQRRLLLGRASGSRADLTLAAHHAIDLGALPTPGTYFCEILAFSEEDWMTLDDDGGSHYTVVV